MDSTSYADLAVRLVNAGGSGRLDSVGDYRALAAGWPHLNGPVTPAELDALRLLRAELAKIFALAANEAECDAVALLNALVVRYPVHPQISGHDDQPWHLHLCDTGSAADRYAAGAVFGLMTTVTAAGPGALRTCEAASCPAVFIDASPDRSCHQCPGHGQPRAIVTALRGRRPRRQQQPASTASA